MKYKKIVTALLTVFSLATISFATSCGLLPDTSHSDSNTANSSDASGQDVEASYEFEGLKDVKLALDAESYDFVKDVKAYKNFEETSFTVDSAAVEFGKAGEYTVTYKVDNYTETIKVYVYGMPQFTVVDATVSYLDAQTEATLKKAVSAKDTFGEDLNVTVKEGIYANAEGYIAYGEYDVVFSAEDSVGNKAEYTCKITVSDDDKPVFQAVEIDLVEVDKVTRLNDLKINKIFYNNTALTAEEYSYINGYLTFSESFILSKEAGSEYSLLVVTDKGYNTMTLKITDDQDAKYALNVSDMGYADTLTIEKAQLVSNQKNITFEYALKNGEGERVELTETENGYAFTPGLDTSFTLTVTAKRGTESAGVKEFPFTVQDDVYMWMVDRSNNADKLNFVLNDNYVYGYTTEQSYNGTGALKIEVLEGGAAQLLLKNVAQVAPGTATTLSFYIYNPSGIALQSCVTTNSGYWINQGMEVLSSVADITAETGWQKVSITFRAGFDGSLDSMSTFAENASQAELRVYNPDGWTWTGEGDFTFYMSNVYLETVHGEEAVSYNESNHQKNGVVGQPVLLASASSTDGRYTFTYEVKKDDEIVTMSTDAMTFTPASEGEYTYTITSYWRGTLVATKSYTINVAGALALSANAYYQYDADGNVTLPAASCGIEGATLVYTVINPEGKAVELDEDMVYATKGVAGKYVYTVDAMVNGDVIASETKDILIHSANVYYGFGVDQDISQSVSVRGETSVSYCETESAAGELGSLKMDNSVETNTEKGNFAIQLGANAANYATLTFSVKFTGDKPLDVIVYSQPTWMYLNFWYEGTKYETWDNRPVQGDGQWHEITVLLTSPAGTHVSGGDIRIQFQSESYAWGEGQAPVIYISNIYYDLPTFATDPEEPTIPANVLVANGCGESNFQGNLISMNNGTTHTYCAEESAPGEVGSLKLDTTNHNNGELGNFSLWLSETEVIGKSMLTFYIKHTGTKPLDVSVYSTNTGSYVNYWYNGTRYDTWDNFPIQGSNEWQKIEVLLTDAIGRPIGGAAVQLSIASQGYAWGEGEAPVIYLSNIYYS